MRDWRLFALLLAALLLTACASPGDRPSGERTGELYARHAGGSAEHVIFSSVRNWKPAGREGIVVEFNGRRHYLLTLTAPCDFELQHAVRLQLINSQPNLITRFDRVRLGQETCRITSIRAVDMEAVRQEIEAQRLATPEKNEAITVVRRDQDSGGT